METPNAVERDAKEAWAVLQRLRDEARLKLHLAGMDARVEWDRLEALMPKMEEEMERDAGNASKAVRLTLRASIDDAIRSLERFSASIKKG